MGIGSYIAKSLKSSVAGGYKWGKRGALIGAGVVAVPLAVGAIRNARSADDDLPPPPPRELADPIPQVLEAPALGQDTLMGMTPVEGTFAQRVKAGRAGGMGVDTSMPNLMRADGRNSIDGSQGIQELNAPSGRGIG